MGQRVGKAQFDGAAEPFVSLAAGDLEQLWRSFNEVAEGFGLRPGELRRICASANRPFSGADVDALFRALDTDANGLIDALEMLAGLALASALDDDEKVDFIVRLYDLDESGALTVDEVTLALKGALSGVAKLAAEDPPLETALDAMARLAFARSDRDPSTRLSRGELRRFCASSPEARSWVAYFRDASPEAVSRSDVGSSSGAGAPSHPEDDPWLAAELAVQAPEAPGTSAAVRAALRPEDPASRAFREHSRAEAHMGPAAEQLASMAWFEQARHLVPSTPPPPSTLLPDTEARLEWANCFSGGAGRSLAAYGAGNRVVFAASALAVSVAPRPTASQARRSGAGGARTGSNKLVTADPSSGSAGSSAALFCREHTGPVVSLAVHPAGEVVATGERGPAPRVVVWRPGRAAAGSGSTAEVVRVLSGLHSAAVTHCAFSPSGALLATVGADPTRRVVVFDWAAGRHRCATEGGSAGAGEGLVALADQNTARETLGCCWRDERTLVTVGRDHLALWDVAGRRKSVGLFGAAPGVAVQTLLCVAAFGGDGPRGSGEGAMLATGTMSGHVYLWRGRCCVRAVRAHEGPVLALSGAGRGLATGSADGRVRVWSGRMECESTADVSALGPFDAAVCSVDWDPARGRILVGTRGCELFEVVAADGRNAHEDAGGGPLVQGHGRHEVWGLAAHPARPEYCTVGDDGTLRVWDASARRLARLARLGCPARAVAYSPEGDFLAVGLGAAAERSAVRARLPDKAGGFVVVRSADLSLVHSARDARGPVTALAFAPDGRTLALGSADSNIYLYEGADFSLRCVCTAHGAAVTALDFSEGGDMLQSCDADLQHLFFHCDDGRRQAAVAAMKDVVWSTWTCPVGWHAQGLWPEVALGSAVLTVARSGGGEVVATSDTSGRLSLQRFPTLSSAYPAVPLSGHGAPVAAIAWLANDAGLVTVGAADRSVMQWSVTGWTGPAEPTEGRQRGGAAGHAGGSRGRGGDDDDDADQAAASLGEPAPRSAEAARLAAEEATEETLAVEPDSEDEEDLASAGSRARTLALEASSTLDAEERTALVALRRTRLPGPPVEGAPAGAEGRPGAGRARAAAAATAAAEEEDGVRAVEPPDAATRWRALSVEPTVPPPAGAGLSLPDTTAELEWVHGYSGRHTRGSARYVLGGQVAYPAAALGVLLSQQKRSQSFLLHHTGEVSGLAVHPSGRFVATCQVGRRADVAVWDVVSAQLVACLDPGHDHGVGHVAFAGGDGSLLATSGEDDDHTMRLFDWSAGTAVVSAPGGKGACLGLAVSDGGATVAQVGDGYVLFHHHDGRSCRTRRGALGRVGRRQPFYCAAFRAVPASDVSTVDSADERGAARGPAASTAAASTAAAAAAGGGPGRAGRSPTDNPSASTSAAKAAPWECLVGSHDGHVFVFEFGSRRLSRAVKAHDGAVYAITPATEAGAGLPAGGVATGGRDGFVRLWSANLEPISEIRMADLGSLVAAVRSVDWDPARGRILVGTRGCELFEVVAADGRNAHEDAGGGPLVQGHGRHEVWGLAAHPARPEYCTVGDDGTLRVWDASAPGQAAVAALEGVARAVDYSPDGRFVAVGLGGDVGRGRTREDGKWVVVSTEDWEVVHRAHDTRAAITDVKFCPTGATLGVAARDGRLLLYDVAAGFSLRGVFDRHRSPLVRFDFSRDGKKVRTASAAWELLYADTATGAHLPSAAAMRDVQWATQTVAVGWSMLGAWEQGEEGAGQDLTAVASSRSGALLAVGDSLGGLRIKRYPCPEAGAASHRLRGHPGRVTGAAWLANDTKLVTTGGRDLCVMQWRVLADEDGAKAAAKAVAATPAEADDTEFRVALRDFRAPEAFAAPGAATPAAVDAREACLAPPSRAPPLDPRTPSERLRLEWVYGFRGHDTAGNLAFARNSSLVYTVSALGVSLDAERHSQRHYRGHDADLTCLAVDPSRRLAVSGQGGAVPRVHVWDACGGTPRCVLPAVHAGAVAAVAFSRDARRAVSVALAPGQGTTSPAGAAATAALSSGSVAVYSSPCGDWTDGVVEAIALSGAGRAHFACCLPSGADARSSAASGGGSADGWEDGPASLRFVTGGEDSVRFWRLWQGALSSTAGIWGSKAKRQTVTCGACVAGTLVTGTVSGQLMAWRGRVVARVVDSHDPGTRFRAVNALHAHAAGVIAGCRDGAVRLFGPGLERLAVYRVYDGPSSPDMSFSVQSVALSPDGERLAAGTRGGAVVEVALATGSLVTRADGHAHGAVTAAAAHPTVEALAATAGTDGTLRLWDMEGRRCLSAAALPGPASCVAWSPDGSVLAVGSGAVTDDSSAGEVSGAGALTLLRADTLEAIHECTDASGTALAVKFSPNGALLALVSADGRAYVYDARGGRFSLTYVMEHGHPLRTVDFAEDSSALQAQTAADTLVYLDLRTGRQVASAASMRDTAWASWSASVGWPAQALWPRGADGTEVSRAERSHSRSLLAAGDAFGQVRLVRYPAALPADDTEAVFASAHASTVGALTFSVSDRFLLSTGMHDCAAVQWRVTRGPSDPAAADH